MEDGSWGGVRWAWRRSLDSRGPPVLDQKHIAPIIILDSLPACSYGLCCLAYDDAVLKTT